MLAEKYAAQSDRGLFNAALMTVMCAGFVSDAGGAYTSYDVAVGLWLQQQPPQHPLLLGHELRIVPGVLGGITASACARD